MSKDTLRLQIRIGSSYTDLQPAYVNDPAHATRINNDFFEGSVVVRVKNYKGPSPDSSSPAKSLDESYFAATGDTSSVQFRGLIKADVNADQVLFGNDFDEPIKDSLPPGTSLGLKALKWIDPSLETDLYADKPWAFSPLLATMNLINTTITTTSTSTNNQESGNSNQQSGNSSQDIVDAGDGMDRIEEDTSNLVGEKITVKQRRTYFADQAHRQKHNLHGLTIAGDFSNPFIDFNTLSIALPYVNLHISILQYWKGQPFRYTCKTKSGDVLFCVVFELVNDKGEKITGDKVAEHEQDWKA